MSTTHSELAPSAAHRWLHCHASVSLSRGVIEPESAAAIEGTLAHAHLEHVLSHGAQPDGAYTDEMVDGTNVVLAYLESRQEKYEFWPETKVEFGNLLPAGTMGTSDVILWYPESRTIEVVDYKFGRGVVVEPDENEQMTLYAIGALVTRKLPVPERVVLTIIQPRAYHPNGPVRSWTTDMEYLKNFGRQVKSAVASIYGPSPAFNPSEDTCRWCPGAFKCPSLKSLALERALKEFEPLPDDGDLKELGEALDIARLLEVWRNAVENHALRVALSGQKIPGWKIVEGQSRRKWNDENKVREFFKRKRIPAKEFLKDQVIGIPDAEKLFKKKKLDPADLKPYIVKPEGAKKLAPESDHRSAVAGDFDVID